MFATVLVMWAKKVNSVHFNFTLALIETEFELFDKWTTFFYIIRKEWAHKIKIETENEL